MLTPLKAIRAKCLECSGGSVGEVRNCLVPECALFPFRFGTNPSRRGIGGNRIHLILKPTVRLEISEKTGIVEANAI